jgi:hypothetical protein
MRGRSARRRLVWLAVLVVAALVVVVAIRRRTRPDVPPPLVAVPNAEPVAPPPPKPTSSHAIGATGLLPGDMAADTEEDRYRKRMSEVRRALLEKTRYPIGSQPLAKKTDLLKPHHVEPTMRGLEADPTKNHSILVTQNQDRVWISPGQGAVATITATTDRASAPLTFSRSDLTVQIESDSGQVTQGPIVGHSTFRDDGTPPDATAGDGTYSASVLIPAGQPPGAVVLSVDAAGEDGESGTLLFNFVQTASATATFTQTARDALENGSIAVYVGIQVQQAGLYEVVGRLYDGTGMPTVYMRFIGQLTTATTEVRLLAFGKVILDEGGVPPFDLQDVEGAEMLVGQYPDRAPMADWTGPYALQGNYTLSQLSDADYDGADKQRKLAALDQAEKDGLANIKANPAPLATPASH